MKTLVLSIFLFAIALIGNSQNKKEQIVVLNNRVDSCKTVIHSNQKTIDSCKIILESRFQEIVKKEKKISELEQKITKETQLSQDKTNEVLALKKEIEALKEKIPAVAFFKYEITNLVKSQNGRIGTASETEVYLIIEGNVIDTYNEYGNPDIDQKKQSISLLSDLSEKSYNVSASNSSKVIVSYYLFCSDCDMQESEKELVYLKNSAGQWIFSHCTGDCD